MKLHPYFTALLLAALPAHGADDGKKPGDPPAAENGGEATLSKEVMGFYGTVAGTVDSVDSAEVTLKVKVSKAGADAAKNKAPQPEALEGMTITITPLAKMKDGKSVLDEKASGYIKGAKSGDPVTLAVRASSKGVVFRLLKVPSAGTK